MNPFQAADESIPAEPSASARSGGTGGNGAESRLARLETLVERVATKEDIQKIAVWVLGGAIVGIMFGATAAVGIFKLLE